jgi:hypothetical protein
MKASSRHRFNEEALMRIARVLAVMTFVAFWPATAHAARSWWGWLEELSGPGPFMGTLYSIPVVCWGAEGRVDCENYHRPKDAKPEDDRDRRIKRSLQITAGLLSSGHQPRFDNLVGIPEEERDNRRRVFAVPVNAAFMFRPHRSLDIGPGAGLVYFTGRDVHANARFVLIPVSGSLKFLLLGKAKNSPWRRMLSVEYQLSHVTKGFNPEDFGSSKGSLRNRREFLNSFGLAVDIGEMFKAR